MRTTQDALDVSSLMPQCDATFGGGPSQAPLRRNVYRAKLDAADQDAHQLGCPLRRGTLEREENPSRRSAEEEAMLMSPRLIRIRQDRSCPELLDERVFRQVRLSQAHGSRTSLQRRLRACKGTEQYREAHYQ
jgi:hypothetical protein